MRRRAVLCLALLLAPLAAWAEEVVLGLSQDEVAITATFDGSTLLIFGAVWTMFTLGMIAMFWLSDKGAASLIDTMIIYQRG